MCTSGLVSGSCLSGRRGPVRGHMVSRAVMSRGAEPAVRCCQNGFLFGYHISFIYLEKMIQSADLSSQKFWQSDFFSSEQKKKRSPFRKSFSNGCRSWITALKKKKKLNNYHSISHHIIHKCSNEMRVLGESGLQMESGNTFPFCFVLSACGKTSIRRGRQRSRTCCRVASAPHDQLSP